MILSKEEVRRLVKIGLENGTQQEMSNFAEQVYYVRLSKNLGLHKNALNLMQGANNLYNDTSAVKKLKQTLNHQTRSQISTQTRNYDR